MAPAHSVTLNWQAPANSVVQSYNVKRAPAGPNPVFTTIGTSPITSFVDTNVVEGASYVYEVDAVNTAGEGAPSNIASASIPFRVPDPPTNLGTTVI